ncbi:MAG TPA: surface-adhesin E family protein [Sphingomonadaceae bacterium]|nr:surface-adhesin E family protein [Sphingomonadaceae bacterium]
MRKKLLLGLTLTTGLTAPAMAEKWHEIGSSEDTVAYADEDSIKANGSIVSMDVFQGFEGGHGENRNVYYTKSSMELDCTGRKARELRIDVFGADHAMLPPLPIDTSWQAVTDGTFAGVYSKMACDGERSAGVFTDPFSAADDYWEYMYYYGE